MTVEINSQWGKYSISKDYQPGEYIFHQGDTGDEMYVVATGQVVILKETPGEPVITLGYRNPDEIFGEIGLLVEIQRTASVMAVKPTKLFIINRNLFWEMMHTNYDFQDTVVRGLIKALILADRSRVTSATVEQDLESRMENLSDEKTRLEEIMRLRQDTINFVVHDLRNPLNLITMALSMLEDDIDKESRQFVEIAQEGTNRMLVLVDAMLDVERLEGDEVVLDYDVFDVGQLLEDVVGRIRPLAERDGRQVVYRPRSNKIPTTITADKLRIERVVVNLMDNAVKYTPRGGTITVSSGYHDGWFMVSVNDTGPGMTDSERERVFERFAQVSETDRRRGFGLGLAFCRSAIKAHDGKIWVEEGDGGVGSKFIFTLPANPVGSRA